MHHAKCLGVWRGIFNSAFTCTLFACACYFDWKRTCCQIITYIHAYTVGSHTFKDAATWLYRVEHNRPEESLWPKNPRSGTWIVLYPHLFHCWRYESNYHGCLRKTCFSNFGEDWAVILPCPTLDKMSHWLLPLKSVYNVLAQSQVHSSPLH